MTKLNFARLRRFRSQPPGSHEVRYDCPLCGGAGKLYANLVKHRWICFKCGERGSINDKSIAVEPVPQLYGEPVRTFKWATHPDIRGSALNYLKAHNVNIDVAFHAGCRSGKGDAESRLVIPVRKLGRVVFRVAHSTTGAIPKEIQSGERWPWAPLRDYSRHRCGATAILVEGAADALRVESALVQDERLLFNAFAVCLWGKTISEEHAFALAGAFRNFYILLDRPADENLPRGGETDSALKLFHIFSAIADGTVRMHKWGEADTRDSGVFKGIGITLANDPAELNDASVNRLLRKVATL